MKYQVDHDLHIHSQISLCSGDPEQTPERILQYAEENGLQTVCLTDHFWDETVPGASDWYSEQNFARIQAARPLPQGKTARFLFGCEAEMDKHMTVGVAKERFDSFDFVIIPTTHLHMLGFTVEPEDMETPQRRANIWVRRLEALLNQELPFHKIGIAHLTGVIGDRALHMESLRCISDADLRRLFTKVAALGAGIELNAYNIREAQEGDTDVILRIYRAAKECGCKFYCGSDAHHPDALDIAVPNFRWIAEQLELEETDKFRVPGFDLR